MKPTVKVRWLGRIAFADALGLQDQAVARRRVEENVVDEILLLEHEPVYTIGRTPDQSSLGSQQSLPHPLFAINRGGQATYHGPGQLIGYPILDLKRYGRDLHRYLRWIEGTLIELLRSYEINAQTREGLTGVWVEQRKIASIGVGVRHWVSMHGFALNVCGDLQPFTSIVPCGISGVKMTSVERESGRSISVIDAANDFEKMAGESLEAFAASAGPGAAVAQEYDRVRG